MMTSTPGNEIVRGRIRSRSLQGVLFYLACALLMGSLACLEAGQAPSPQRDEVKVLTIGNSFSNNAVSYLPAMAKAEGKTLVLFQAAIGGASFSRHVQHLKAYEADPESEEGRPYKDRVHPVTNEKKDFSLREALEADDWDYVTIQQVSQNSYKPETYDDAHVLIEYIRKYAPNAEILVHQTWPYRDDYPGYKDGFSRDKMYEGLTAAYQQLANQYGFRIIPSGDAFQMAQQTPQWTYKKDPDYDFENPRVGKLPKQEGSLYTGYLWRKKDGKNQLQLDFKHANAAGKYLGACVWYEMLFGTPAPDNAKIAANLTPEEMASLREIAHRAVQARQASN